jgi:hypothetical protein
LSYKSNSRNAPVVELDRLADCELSHVAQIIGEVFSRGLSRKNGGCFGPKSWLSASSNVADVAGSSRGKGERVAYVSYRPTSPPPDRCITTVSWLGILTTTAQTQKRYESLSIIQAPANSSALFNPNISGHRVRPYDAPEGVPFKEQSLRQQTIEGTEGPQSCQGTSGASEFRAFRGSSEHRDMDSDI